MFNRSKHINNDFDRPNSIFKFLQIYLGNLPCFVANLNSTYLKRCWCKFFGNKFVTVFFKLIFAPLQAVTIYKMRRSMFLIFIIIIINSKSTVDGFFYDVAPLGELFALFSGEKMYRGLFLRIDVSCKFVCIPHFLDVKFQSGSVFFNLFTLTSTLLVSLEPHRKVF